MGQQTPSSFKDKLKDITVLIIGILSFVLIAWTFISTTSKNDIQETLMLLAIVGIIAALFVLYLQLIKSR